MDAAWIAAALVMLGVSLDGMPEGQAEQVRREAAQSLTDDLYVTGVVLPHVGEPVANRHTTFQPISGGQLESGFAQAGSGTNPFGSTLQQGATNAQQAFTATQQQFNAAAGDTQRTIGGEVREGATRLFGRAGDALQKTGDAIGGTARRFRDGIRSVLPGGRDTPQPATVAPPATSGFPAFPVQQPAAGSGTAPAATAPFVTAAPVNPPLNTTLTPTTAAGSGTAPTTTAVTQPATTAPGIGFPPLNTTQPSTMPSTTPVTTAAPSFRTPIANNAQQTLPEMTRPFQSPTQQPTTAAATVPANGSFFDATNRFGQPSGGTTPVAPPASNDFQTTNPQFGGQAGGQFGGFANNPPPASNQSGFDAQPNPFLNNQQPLAPPANSQPGTSPWFNASAPAGVQNQPFDQQVARPTDTFSPPLAGPGSITLGPLNPPQQTVAQQRGFDEETMSLPPQTPPDDSEPWKSLVLATLVAVGSVGGNLFLGWSYLDARNKYRSALRRTTQAFGRASLSGQ